MATFSTNQVRHFYVVNKLESDSANMPSANAGTIAVKSDNKKSHLYFQYKGADNLMRSDLIDIKNILSVKATDADQMSHNLKRVKVTLDSNVNGGNPVSGQDYILRIAFRQYIGMSDEDLYFKYGLVHAYSSMTVKDFYKILAVSLAKNFSRELVPLVKFTLATSSDENADVVTASTKLDSLTKEYTALYIEELPQEWVLGTKQQVPVYFEVYPTTIRVDGDDVVWGKVEKAESVNSLHNGKTIADLEYFCMGERGDMYGNINWPNSIPTKYLIDSNKKYNVIDIHYAYVGENEGVQKSEKTITLAIPKEGESNSVSNVLANNVITAINTATGLTIDKLETT